MRRISNISDWQLKREKIDRPSEGITHALWESNDKVFAFYFYNINEWGIMKNFSTLQILKNKDNPIILYGSKKTIFDYNPYTDLFTEIDWTDNGFLVLRQLIDHGRKRPIIIIKLEDMTYFSIDKFYVKLELTDNILTTSETFYNKEPELNKTIIETYKLDNLKWESIDKLK